jgi:hypothetical protein
VRVCDAGRDSEMGRDGVRLRVSLQKTKKKAAIEVDGGGSELTGSDCGKQRKRGCGRTTARRGDGSRGSGYHLDGRTAART